MPIGCDLSFTVTITRKVSLLIVFVAVCVFFSELLDGTQFEGSDDVIKEV